MHHPSKDKLKEIAGKRIIILFKQAEEIASKNKTLANRYINLARKIAMKAKVSFPSNLKRKFCKHCYHFLIPSINSRVRTKNRKVIIYCYDCKKYTRIPIIKK